ncbi:MAG: MFS transporter [Polyangiaceae bacterium]
MTAPFGWFGEAGTESTPMSTRQSDASDASAAVPESESLFSKHFVLLLVVQFCFGMSYTCFFLLPKYLARQFQANADTIGAVAAAALLAGVIASPSMGAWLDRGARRPFITLGALVNALSGAGFAFVHAVSAPLYALRVVHGISYALVFNSVLTLAADLAPPKKLGQAIGLCGAAGMIANAIAPAIAESVADHHGWPLVFELAGAAALLSALLSFGIAEPRPSTRAATLNAHAHAVTPASTSADTLPSVLSLIRDPRRAGAFVCSAANGAAFGVMFTFTQPFALSLGASKVSRFFIGYTVCALAVRLFLGSLADTYGRRRVAFTGLGLYGLIAAMTSLLRPDLLFAVGAGVGFAHGLLYPAINALAAEGVPRERRGAVMTYFFAAFNTGFAFWVFGFGLVAKSHGYPVVFLATGALVWLSVLFLPKKPVVAASA